MEGVQMGLPLRRNAACWLWPLWCGGNEVCGSEVGGNEVCVLISLVVAVIKIYFVWSASPITKLYFPRENYLDYVIVVEF